MTEINDVHVDLQLEDVEDYNADFPNTKGFPEDVDNDNLHTTGDGPKYRRARIAGLIRTNKWFLLLLSIVLVVMVVIIGAASGGGMKSSSSSSVDGNSQGNGDDKSDNALAPVGDPPIYVDPTTIHSSVADALTLKLVATYTRNGIDPVNLQVAASANGLTAQRKAFYWLATDDVLEEEDHGEFIQRYALACFYYATNMVAHKYYTAPDPWLSAGKWLSKAHSCEWKGVICNGQQHAIGIKLESNNLSGGLPNELGFLGTKLIELDFSHNKLHLEGDGFNVFETFTVLETLLMDDNYLVTHTNGLPWQFKTLKNLEKIRVSYNLFAGELESEHTVLGHMGKLTHLEIESNFLTGNMPDAVKDMNSLVYIYLRRNEMKFNLDFLKSASLSNLCKFCIVL
jgi:hypothetical protein